MKAPRIASGWGDLVGSMIVIGATNDNRFVSRTMEMVYFHNPMFKEQAYLKRTFELIEDIFKELGVDTSWDILICRGYVLSYAREKLREQGFNVVERIIDGEAQKFAEGEYNRLLKDLGCSRHQTLMRRWLRDDLQNRARYAKSGWKAYKRIIS